MQRTDFDIACAWRLLWRLARIVCKSSFLRKIIQSQNWDLLQKAISLCDQRRIHSMCRGCCRIVEYDSMRQFELCLDCYHFRPTWGVERPRVSILAEQPSIRDRWRLAWRQARLPLQERQYQFQTPFLVEAHRLLACRRTWEVCRRCCRPLMGLVFAEQSYRAGYEICGGCAVYTPDQVRAQVRAQFGLPELKPGTLIRQDDRSGCGLRVFKRNHLKEVVDSVLIDPFPDDEDDDEWEEENQPCSNEILTNEILST